MGYPIKPPDIDPIATHPKYGRLYACLCDVPLYCQVRLIAPAPLVGKRRSFWLGWIIKGARLANNKDRFALPEDAVDWIAAAVCDAYPNHEESTGMTEEEVAELEAEQKEKRKKHEKPQ